MSSPRQRISARDYKHGGGRRDGFDIAKYQQFGVGLAAGLLVALGVFVMDHRAKSTDADAEPKPAAAKKVASEAPGSESDDPAEQYDFYDKLANYEVVIPERERAVRGDQTSAPVVQAGNYVLQAGSFRNLPDAERLRDKLGKQGIDATLQRVAIDADVMHRVRIGPISDLKKLNDTRSRLRKADVDAVIIRLPD